MVRPIKVESRERYRVWLKFEDGTEGEVDLSRYAGKGVFSAWKRPGVFENVRITDEGALEWQGGLDLCGDALYMELTGNSPEEVFPSIRTIHVDA